MIEINETLALTPEHVLTANELIMKLNGIMMDKFLLIGFVSIVCGAWHMSKASHNNNLRTAFISGFIDMAAFGSGIAAFAFYAIYRGWI
jgi:hypothetical protein